MWFDKNINTVIQQQYLIDEIQCNNLIGSNVKTLKWQLSIPIYRIGTNTYMKSTCYNANKTHVFAECCLPGRFCATLYIKDGERD